MLPVDEDLSVLHNEVVAFIHLDRSFVDGDIVHVQVNLLTLLRNPQRTIVVARPAIGGIARIHLVVAPDLRVQLNALHHILAHGQGGSSLLRERHHAIAVQLCKLLHGDAQLLHELVGHVLLQFHTVGILHVVGLLVGLAVEVYHAVLHLQRLTGQTHAALHVVLAAVGGSRGYRAILHGVRQQILTAHLVDILIQLIHLLLVHRREVGHAHILRIQLLTVVVHHAVILRLVGKLRENGVAGGIVEHHDVVQLHIAQTFHTTVVPVRPLYVRLRADERQRVLRERHRQRCLRDARAIAHLRHKQVVAREQALLQRAAGNDVVLEEELVDEVDGDQGKHQCVHPRHDEAHGAFGILPPLPTNLFRDVGIEDEGHHQQSPPRLHPVEEQQVECQHYDELRPLGRHILFLLIRFSFFHYCLLIVV